MTIGIPTFNRSAFLLEALEALKQSIGQSDKVELIVCDNASTDDTEAVVQQFIKSFRRVKYYRNPGNIGANLNVWKATNLAEGGYVWILGDDDRVRPEAVPRILNYIENGFDFIILNSARFDNKMAKMISSKEFPFKADVKPADADEAIAILAEKPGFISCVIARKDILTSITEEQVEKYAKVGFNQLYAFYSGIRRCPKGVITSDVLLDNRMDNWHEFDVEHYFIFGLGMIFEDLENKAGYSKWATKQAADSLLQRFVFGRIISSRLNGRDTTYLKEMLCSKYSRTATFWLCMILFALPLPILKMSKLTKNFFKRA